MAKMKTFAVDVEIVVKRTLFVEARRPGGAAEKVLSKEGLQEATRYTEEPDLWDHVLYGGTNLTITNVRVMT